MNAFFQRSLPWLVCLAWLAAASPSWGQECLSLSPSIQAGKDPFAAIEPRDLTAAEHEGLVRLFKSLAGNWQGRADTFFCRSTADPADRIVEKLAAGAKVEVDYYGNLVMDGELFNEADRTRADKDLYLYLNNRRLRIDHDTGAGDVEIQNISERGLSFFYRRVVATGSTGGSARREYFFSLHVEGKRMQIEQTIYVQGKLSSGYTLLLER
ncbi:MAG: hypothetical protein HY911_14110 [Desulfobacterales bacterium]|nr:hypothetical protein [Desulfobacterales bacterium]